MHCRLLNNHKNQGCFSLFILSSSLLLSSCASIYTQIAGHSNDPTVCNEETGFGPVYSGTHFDAECIGYENVGFFCLVDLPMSLVLDTLLLPYTGYVSIFGAGYCAEDTAQHNENKVE